jgi:hypothetical protein
MLLSGFHRHFLADIAMPCTPGIDGVYVRALYPEEQLVLVLYPEAYKNLLNINFVRYATATLTRLLPFYNRC